MDLRSRLAAITGALVVVLLGTGLYFAPVMTGSGVAAAQDRPRTLFDMLFSPRRNREPPAVKEPRPAARKTAPRRAATPAAPPPPVAVDKNENARVVLVVGDFIAAGLAEGLATAYEENPSVRVVDKTSGSSGLVRDDHYDWPAEIEPLLEAEKPAVVVMMIGSNDRQEMRVGATREPKRSEAWTAEYQNRVKKVATIVRSKGLPLVWVGMVPFRQNAMSTDMIAFNDIYRGTVEEVGGVFIDIWDGFVDANGAYVTSGPDMNGNPVRLRSGDNGINLTRPGKRKMAFFAEKPLERIIGPGRAAPGALTPFEPLPGIVTGPRAPAEIDRTVPMSLFDPAIDGGAELLGASFQPSGGEPATPGEKMIVQGIAPMPVSGRADDFGGEIRPAAAVEPEIRAEIPAAIAEERSTP